MSELITIREHWPKEPFARFKFSVRLIRWADQVGPMVREALKREAPEKTGRLRQGIRYQRELSPMGARIRWTSAAPYTDYVLHGTRPHGIDARATKALRFMDSRGGVAFRRHVNHPGAKADDFPARVVPAVLPGMYASFVRTVTEGL